MIEQSSVRYRSRSKGTLPVTKLAFLALIGCFWCIISCTPPPAESTGKSTPDAQEETSAQADTAQPEEKPAMLAVEQWVGHDFVALPISPTFSKFGYELYPTAAMDEETAPIDKSLQLANHRYSYSALLEQVLTAKSVTKDGDEYTVQFEIKSTGKPAYARTRHGALKGIAASEDLVASRSRWEGKEVFSRKRLINIYDSTSGQMRALKVGMGVPLKVVQVAWGVLPLPPQPLWLTVQTPDGKKGFVPLHISWTNVMRDKVGKGMPWNEFILEYNPREKDPWDNEIWGQINSHRLMTGMTMEQARLTWGDPAEKDTIETDGKKLVRWAYPGKYLLFADGKLAETKPR